MMVTGICAGAGFICSCSGAAISMTSQSKPHRRHYRLILHIRKIIFQSVTTPMDNILTLAHLGDKNVHVDYDSSPLSSTSRSGRSLVGGQGVANPALA